MSYGHVILEILCLKSKSDKENLPEYCCYENFGPGLHCLTNDCPHHEYCEAPYEIAYSDDRGEVRAEGGWVGFSPEMHPEDATEEELEFFRARWKEICLEKVKEAYEKYMEEYKKIV